MTSLPSEASQIEIAVIDAFEFARGKQALSGSLAVSALTRLGDVLADTVGTLACTVSGEQDKDGKLFLRIGVSGELRLKCQRCLEPLEYPIHISNRLQLVPPGASWPDDELEDDGSDAIAAEREQALLPLIEDELLLFLPLSPRHAAKVCGLMGIAGVAGVANDGRGMSPFSALVQIKKP